MPRLARTQSNSGIYHIMMRGVNKQTIFEDDEDKQRFLETLARYKEHCQYEIYSYCLMDNHVHLLLKETDEPISNSIKRISSSYVYWYNRKYNRSGHLFQERFRSENVETWSYFLTVLRYIHQNPLKAGLAQSVFDGRWTSINEYLGTPTLINIDYALNLFSDDRKKAIAHLIDFMEQTTDDKCLDDKVSISISDGEVKSCLQTLGITNSSTLQQMEKEKRDAILSEVKKIEGVSVRQISRITGVSKSVIQRIQ